MKIGEHAVLTYNSQEVALAVSVELLLRSLNSGCSVILIRSPSQIDSTIQSLTVSGFDTHALTKSNRFATISNEIFLKVSDKYFLQLTEFRILLLSDEWNGQKA